jgi:hypothetical protein
MDEQSQFREVLDAVRTILPASVVTTCENLNAHGEWELALSHCQIYLQESGEILPTPVVERIAACEARFKSAADT